MSERDARWRAEAEEAWVRGTLIDEYVELRAELEELKRQSETEPGHAGCAPWDSGDRIEIGDGSDSPEASGLRQDGEVLGPFGTAWEYKVWSPEWDQVIATRWAYATQEARDAGCGGCAIGRGNLVVGFPPKEE